MAPNEDPPNENGGIHRQTVTLPDVDPFTIQPTYQLDRFEFEILRKPPKWYRRLVPVFLGVLAGQGLLLLGKFLEWLLSDAPRPELVGSTIEGWELLMAGLALLGVMIAAFSPRKLPGRRGKKVDEINSFFEENPSETEFRQR